MSKKPLPKIDHCECNSSAVVVFDIYDRRRTYTVSCAHPMCCVGPSRKTERGAINAWNKKTDGEFSPRTKRLLAQLDKFQAASKRSQLIVGEKL